MSKHDGKLYYIREEDLKLLKSNPKEFWDGVTIIYDKAFRGLTDLESIIIPNSVTEIYQRVFSRCKNLKKIVLPNKLEFIGRYSLPCEVDIGIGDQTAHFKSPFFDLSMQINYQLKNLTNTNNANNYLDKIASLINNYVNVKHFEQSDLDKLDMSNWLKLKENYLDKYSSFKFYSDLENHNSRYYDEEDIERITDELTFLSEFARAIGLFDGETTYDIEDSNGNLHKIKASALAYRFLDKFFKHFVLGSVVPRLSIANRGSINKDFLIFINKNADRILKVAETEREILSGIEEMFAVDVKEDTSDMVLDCKNNYSQEESKDTERE